MSAAGNGAPSSGTLEDDIRRTHTDSTVMDGLSSSKVTVEYHDPSGIFALIQDDLAARLPLRNLHWKSPTRPLRSIDSLHIDLVPSKDSIQSSASIVPPQGATGTPTRTTEEILRPPVKEKERRHQIPGLRQTPYLKVYLLRCDDSETYKATARKQVREWVKEHTPPSQSSSSSSTQENHDAYEWMIIHVVIPDTPAASQPRGSSSLATGEKEKGGSSSVWKRGTSTLLEKLRADFNISSKTAPDRVAQIRLTKEKIPPHMLPTPAPVTSPSIAESLQEQDQAWSDVIVKLKTLILLSFDLRVSQYEEDIRKNDAQRHFPGWNFNTFFILKEGLARGFESVGLVEDALLGYDELSVGLDTVIRDQAQEGSEAQGIILNHSEDLYEQASAILKDSNSAAFHDEKTINCQKKDYRGLILANNISIFDFRLYIFSRQMSLLLRLGNSHSARSDLAAKLQPRASTRNAAEDSQPKSADLSNGTEDLFSLAELCSRAINFITFAGRLLRDDLAKGGQFHDALFPEAFLDNIVRSWTYSALEQILTETSTLSLPFTRYASERSTGSSGKTLPFGNHSKEQKLRVSEQKSMHHPARSSSLNTGRSAGDMPYAASTGQVIFENGQYNDRPTPTQDNSVLQTKNGQQDLAAFRAQLVTIQRRLLEQVGKSLGWSIGWAAILSVSGQDAEMTEVDLDEDAEPTVTAPTPVNTELTSPILGIFAASLITASSSKEQFRQSFEAISDMIVKHHMAAGQHKATEAVLGDLAALKFETGDFAAAAAYFGKMSSMSSSIFAQGRWNTVETTMLKMYAQCLKKLNRKDEYVRTLLDVLARSAASRMSVEKSANNKDEPSTASMPRNWLNDDDIDAMNVFNELVDFSQQLPYDVTVPMAKYFAAINVEPYVRHYDDKDGFQLRLTFRHVLEDEIDVKSAKIHLVSANNSQIKDIWLEVSGPFKLKRGHHGLMLGCNVNTIGPYMVDKVVLEAKRIVFAHEPFTKTEATTPLGIMTSVSAHSLKAAKKARILCFPRPEALDARVYLSHFIHIDKPRHVEIELKSGWNETTGAEIRLKAASAGLRLRTANVTVVAGNIFIDDKDSPGVIKIGAMEMNTAAVLKVPYDCENVLQELALKLEIDYITNSGQFQFLSAYAVPVELPLDVNVHDHFKRQMLISKFNIKTANEVPLELLNVELQGSDEFDVIAPKRNTEPVCVYPRQPVAVTYRITRKNINVEQRRQSKGSTAGSLALLVEYKMLNEDVRDRLSTYFDIAIADSPVRFASRLLKHTFVDRLEHIVLPHQYERIALLDKVDLGSFDAMNWQDCLNGLPQNVRDDAKTWLQDWHESNKTIYLKDPTDRTAVAPASPFPSRSMVITVSIPQTHILNTAALKLMNASTCSHQVVAITGKPVSATLQISHTRKWGSSSSLVTAANITSASDPIDFTYTLEANSESWLIAGQRRAHFIAKEDEVLKWQILLVPLKPGVVLLPSIEIRPRIKVREDGKEAEPLNCETDYLDYGETIMVIPDVRSSTVGIGDMSLGSAKSVVLLESAGA